MGKIMEATEDDRAVYAQRFETFRHFDSLRWQSTTITLTGGGILLGLSSPEGDLIPPWWALLVFSLLSGFSAFLVHRVRKGIHLNNEVLAIYA